jgi:hypothetical protein
MHSSRSWSVRTTHVSTGHEPRAAHRVESSPDPKRQRERGSPCTAVGSQKYWYGLSSACTASSALAVLIGDVACPPIRLLRERRPPGSRSVEDTSRQLVAPHGWGTLLGVWTRHIQPAHPPPLAREGPGVEVCAAVSCPSAHGCCVSPEVCSTQSAQWATGWFASIAVRRVSRACLMARRGATRVSRLLNLLFASLSAPNAPNGAQRSN